MTMTNQQGQPLRHDEIKQGVVLVPPGDGVRCSVERIDGASAFIRVLDNRTYNGQKEFTLNIEDMINGRWQLSRQAA